MTLLSGKTVLVTGGSRGIGQAIVEKAVEQGANVAFTYRSSAEKANAIVAQLSTDNNIVKAYQSDAASWDDSEALVKEVINDFGGLDVLVNNAGITKDNLLLRMNVDDWDAVMHTNLRSVFNLTKQVMRPMMRKRGGSIINISSIVGIKGQAGQANYAASKAGIIGFTKSVAQEMGSRNIRCNAIAPGFIETDMTEDLDTGNFLGNIPLKRLGKPNDIADAVVFLASDMSTYVTGQVLSVCGGLAC